MSLDEIRQRIDAIDSEIIRLLDQRAQAGREVGKAKRLLGLPPHNPGRERDVLARLRGLSDGSMPASAIDAIYRAIMAETLALQTGPVEEGGCAGHHAGNGKRDVAATVVDNARVAPGFYRMRLRARELAGAFRPGQFFQVRLRDGDGKGFFLRRPFAPSAYTDIGFDFIYAVVGRGTDALTRALPGTRLNVLAPLGNAYSLPAAGSHAVLVGGGCGGPSLAPLAGKLRESGVRVTVCLGARTSEALLDQETFGKAADRLLIATDDGSHGCRGTVIDAITRDLDSLPKIDRVYACGPVPMLRAVARFAEGHGVGCEVSLEERMACGFGACMGCVVPVVGGGSGSVFRRVCHDGPVFDAKALAWDEMR